MHVKTDRRSIRSLRYGALLLVSLLIWPGIASADFVTVDCDTPGSGDGVTSFDNLQAAIDYLHSVGADGFHTIEVTGTCSFPRDNDGDGIQDTDFDSSALWNSFFVADFTNLSIQAPGGLTATLSQPVLTCDIRDRDQGHRLVPLLQIRESPNVRLSGLTITGGRGVNLTNSNVRFEGDVIVTGSHGNGVGVFGAAGSQLTLRGLGNEVGSNCRTGIFAGRGSLADIRNDARIHDNEQFGLLSFEGGRASVGGQTVIEGNLAGGILGTFGAFVTVFGQTLIQNHCCPVKSRIESIGWGHRGIRFGSRMAGVPVKGAFFRIA